jgi:hypothetical protein
MSSFSYSIAKQKIYVQASAGIENDKWSDETFDVGTIEVYPGELNLPPYFKPRLSD